MRFFSFFQDVNDYVPDYQYSSRPAEMFSDTCQSAGFEVVECVAPERSFAFQNINIVKSISSIPILATIKDIYFTLYDVMQPVIDAVAAVNPFLRRVPVWLRERYLLESLVELQKLKSPSTDGTTVARYRLMIAHLRRPSH